VRSTRRSLLYHLIQPDTFPRARSEGDTLANSTYRDTRRSNRKRFRYSVSRTRRHLSQTKNKLYTTTHVILRPVLPSLYVRRCRSYAVYFMFGPIHEFNKDSWRQPNFYQLKCPRIPHLYRRRRLSMSIHAELSSCRKSHQRYFKVLSGISV
jgi:hypothetical protein